MNNLSETGIGGQLAGTAGNVLSNGNPTQIVGLIATGVVAVGGLAILTIGKMLKG